MELGVLCDLCGYSDYVPILYGPPNEHSILLALQDKVRLRVRSYFEEGGMPMWACARCNGILFHQDHFYHSDPLGVERYSEEVARLAKIELTCDAHERELLSGRATLRRGLAALTDKSQSNFVLTSTRLNQIDIWEKEFDLFCRVIDRWPCIYTPGCRWDLAKGESEFPNGCILARRQNLSHE